jgi:hypothetical protein
MSASDVAEAIALDGEQSAATSIEEWDKDTQVTDRSRNLRAGGGHPSTLDTSSFIPASIAIAG